MADKPTNGDRVTNRQLYEAVNELRAEFSEKTKDLLSRREGYYIFGGGLVLGQIAARLDISTLTLTQQGAATLARLLSLN